MGTMSATTVTTQRTTDRVRTWGLVCLAAGVLGAASGILLTLWPEQVPDDRWSYPMTAGGFAAIQAWFAVQHVGLLLGQLALGESGVIGTSRFGRAGHWLAVLGTVVLTVTEVLAIAAKDWTLDQGGWLNGLYGFATTAAGVGFVLAGLAIRKEGRWTGWPSYLVLLMGVWVFVPMFPALLLSFLAARLSITAWMLMYAALGWLLWRAQD